MIGKHIWLIPMYDDFEEKESGDCLSQEEIQRCHRFLRIKDKKKYVYFHSALKRILSSYCKVEPKDIEFTYNQFQKPFLNRPMTGLQFNFSHCTDLAVCAVQVERTVGIDVEQIEEGMDMDSTARLFFSEEERLILNRVQGEDKARIFYSIWTGKEAFGKAMGVGITYPLHQVTIPTSHSGLIREQFLGLDGNYWSIERFFLRENAKEYVVSAVTDCSDENGFHTQFFSYQSKEALILNECIRIC